MYSFNVLQLVATFWLGVKKPYSHEREADIAEERMPDYIDVTEIEITRLSASV